MIKTFLLKYSLIYNVKLDSGVQYRDLVIHVYTDIDADI